MNMMVSETFGEYFIRLPLRKSPNIVCGNALRIDWDSLLIPEKTISIHAKEANIIQSQVHEKDLIYGKVNVFAEKINITDKPSLNGPTEVKFDYIFGNPPFMGSKMMSQKLRMEIGDLFNNKAGAGILDYVSGWYIKAAKYLNQNNFATHEIKCAFVSTNSISQGEQVGVLWNELLYKYLIKIHFAHRTFKWTNEAKGVAAVYCVIIGFSNYDIPEKSIFEYLDIKGEPHQINVKNINPYLVEGNDLLIKSRTRSICNVPRIKFGNQPIDGGNLLMSLDEYELYIVKEPEGKKFIRRYLGSEELINGIKRYCFWLKDANPNEIHNLPLLMKRIDKVSIFRKSSKRKETQELSLTPAKFAFISHEEKDYIIIPSVSSERRHYIPMDFMTSDTIASNLCLIIPGATKYHFGILTSKLHMSWIKYVCGRLKSDFRYSNSIVYNNFPWPENPSEKQVKSVEEAAQKVLDTRAQFTDSSLAVLYDPLTMPPALVKAHQALDKSVDLCYRPQPFISESKRIEYLFELYDKYTAGLFKEEKEKKKKKINKIY
jgi:hypothetical protein